MCGWVVGCGEGRGGGGGLGGLRARFVDGGGGVLDRVWIGIVLVCMWGDSGDWGCGVCESQSVDDCVATRIGLTGMGWGVRGRKSQ